MFLGHKSTRAQLWKSHGISPEGRSGYLLSFSVCVCLAPLLTRLFLSRCWSLCWEINGSPPSSLLPLSSSIHVSLPMLLDLTQVQAVSQSAVHTHTHFIHRFLQCCYSSVVSPVTSFCSGPVSHTVPWASPSVMTLDDSNFQTSLYYAVCRIECFFIFFINSFPNLSAKYEVCHRNSKLKLSKIWICMFQTWLYLICVLFKVINEFPVESDMLHYYIITILTAKLMKTSCTRKLSLKQHFNCRFVPKMSLLCVIL